MKTIVLTISFFSIGCFTKAQSSVSSGGGTGANTNGSISYTIGETVYVKSQNGQLSEGAQQSYDISATLGILEEAKALGIKVYPNPVVDKLILKNENLNTIYTYEIYDTTGKMLIQNKLDSNEKVIDFSKLSASFYILKIKNGQKSLTYKLIKK